MANPQRSEIVSNEAELLILVDSQDRELGHLDKAACHNDSGVLHRAFSLFIFNSRDSCYCNSAPPTKDCGGYWSNSCCSHPRKGETMQQAVSRRLSKNWALAPQCSSFISSNIRLSSTTKAVNTSCARYLSGRFDGAPDVNATEVSDWRWIDSSS